LFFLNKKGLTLKIDSAASGGDKGNLMCVWPCIIYENDERYQLDATIV